MRWLPDVRRLVTGSIPSSQCQTPANRQRPFANLSSLFPDTSTTGSATQAITPTALSGSPSGVHGGARRDRTDDLMLAKHALSQLSYGPFEDGLRRRRRPPSPWLSRASARAAGRPCEALRLRTSRTGKRQTGEQPIRMVGLGRLERPTSPLSGVRSNHLSYRPVPLLRREGHTQHPDAPSRERACGVRKDWRGETKAAAFRQRGT